MPIKAEVSNSCGELVRVGTTVLVFVPELVTEEVATPGTLGKRDVSRIVELAPAPGVVPTREVVSDSFWRTSGVMLEMSKPVSV